MGADRSLARGRRKPPNAALGDTADVATVQRRRAQAADVLHSSNSSVQRKVEVGEPDDQFEKEADAVAERVAAGGTAPRISRLGAEDSVHRATDSAKLDDQEDKDKLPGTVQRTSESDVVEEELADSDAVQRAVQRAAGDESVDDDFEDGETQTRVQASGAAGASHSDVAGRAVGNRGSGRPLDRQTRNVLESGLGADLSGVRVHDDIAARQAASDLNARAFTYGSDIWLGPGESEHDTRLMAHEATHVVQQRGAVQRRIQRQDNDTPQDTAEIDQDLRTFQLPRIKARHMRTYRGWASRGSLVRVAAYDRGNPNQKDGVWLPNVSIPQPKLDALHLDPDNPDRQTINVHNRAITDTYRNLVDLIKVPDWNRRGERLDHPFEVDHIVELQVGNWTGSGPANELQNMELLDKSSNSSAGGGTRSSIRANVRRYLRATQQASGRDAVTNYLDTTPINFDRVELRGSGRTETNSQWWTRAEIERGDQLEGAAPIGNVDESGSATSFALMSIGRKLTLGEYGHDVGQTAIVLEDPVQRKRVSGLDISRFDLDPNYTTKTGTQQLGTATATWDLPPMLNAPTEEFTLPLYRNTQYSAFLGDLPPLDGVEANHLSLANFGQVEQEGNAIRATGQLTPSIPLLNAPIELHLIGDELRFAMYYSPDQLTLPVPGLTIDDAMIGVYVGTEGFGAEGSIDFTIRNLGTGAIYAGVDDEGNFEVSGTLNFDSELFDRAQISVWYRNSGFGGSGTLGIDSPEKVRGIQSAEITVGYDEGVMTATGTINPDIPAIENATLTMTYSEEEGLLVGGTAQLTSDTPGIRSGSLEATVRKRPDADNYELSATGQAQPDIPGLDTSLTIAYDDGALTIEGDAEYSRGMLAGSLSIGVTNRVLSEDGEPTDEIGDSMRAYGGGTVTVQLTPWLAGTVGVHLLPNGEIELMGSIGLPDTLELFPEQVYERNIFSINMDIPIIGVAVAGQRIGIFATIGGGLDLSAGIGPGQLQELGLTITYNPDREDETHIEGGARLVIPAHAGLRMFVRAALGAGIPIVSATLGLEVGGQLGIEGAAEAGVEIDWTPATGLVLDAEIEVWAEPKFRFDITGFAEVTADLLLTEISLYEQRWELAAVEIGSDYRLGLRLPYHQEGDQFAGIDFNAVEFEVPDIDAGEVLGSLVDRIT